MILIVNKVEVELLQYKLVKLTVNDDFKIYKLITVLKIEECYKNLIFVLHLKMQLKTNA